jgi:hypothetical protein
MRKNEDEGKTNLKLEKSRKKEEEEERSSRCPFCAFGCHLGAH